MSLVRRRFLSLAGAAVAAPAVASLAWSQSYPTKPIRFIVPLAAGGGTDFLARLVGEYLSRAFGQQVLVENRTGAGGTIGTEAAAKSPPDGYTVLISNDNIASALFIDYDPQKKFSLVDLVGIKHVLEDSLGVAVDVTTRDSLHPMLRRDIEKSAVRVF